MNPSAVLRSGVDPTLTYSAPACFQKRSSSSVGFADPCPQSFIPGAFLWTVAEAVVSADSSAAAPSAPPTASLTNSLRSGLNLSLAPGTVPISEDTSPMERLLCNIFIVVSLRRAIIPPTACPLTPPRWPLLLDHCSVAQTQLAPAAIERAGRKR